MGSPYAGFGGRNVPPVHSVNCVNWPKGRFCPARGIVSSFPQYHQLKGYSLLFLTRRRGKRRERRKKGEEGCSVPRIRLFPRTALEKVTAGLDFPPGWLLSGCHLPPPSRAFSLFLSVALLGCCKAGRGRWSNGNGGGGASPLLVGF